MMLLQFDKSHTGQSQLILSPNRLRAYCLNPPRKRQFLGQIDVELGVRALADVLTETLSSNTKQFCAIASDRSMNIRPPRACHEGEHVFH